MTAISGCQVAFAAHGRLAYPGGGLSFTSTTGLMKFRCRSADVMTEKMRLRLNPKMDNSGLQFLPT
jgi:hypothetical protein